METACVACQGTDLEFFGERLGYAYHRCTACGTIQLVPQPNEEELARAYETNYAEAGHYGTDPAPCIAASRTYHQSLVDLLRKQGVAGEVLDYGAGWGGLTGLLREGGFRVRGLELGAEMVAHCQREGLPVEAKQLPDLDANAIDAIVMAHVFEHLVNHDAWLQQARRVLRPQGLLVTMQPTSVTGTFVMKVLRALQSDPALPEVYKTFYPPWHTVLYSLEGMRILGERNGFELLSVHPAPQGRVGGVIGAVQVTLEQVNRVGWQAVGETWPLITGHTFIYRSTKRTADETTSAPNDTLEKDTHASV